jgi:hypothetical protein
MLKWQCVYEKGTYIQELKFTVLEDGIGDKEMPKIFNYFINAASD